MNPIIVTLANKNLVSGKDATLSSERSATQGADKAVDGKLMGIASFSVTSPASDHWIRVDLSEIQKLDRIEFYHRLSASESMEV